MPSPPFINTISIGASTWTNADWQADETGTFAEIANAIGAALALLNIGVSIQTKTTSGDWTITTNGFYYVRKTVPQATLVTVDQGIEGPIGIFSDGTADQYPVTVQVALGGTINGSSQIYLAAPWQGIRLDWIGTEYAISASI